MVRQIVVSCFLVGTAGFIGAGAASGASGVLAIESRVVVLVTPVPDKPRIDVDAAIRSTKDPDFKKRKDELAELYEAGVSKVQQELNDSVAKANAEGWVFASISSSPTPSGWLAHTIVFTRPK